MPETCPPGPVQLVFATANCSGDFTIRSISSSPGYGSCAPDGDDSVLVSIEGNKFRTINFPNPDCDSSESYSQVDFTLGECITFNVKKRSDKMFFEGEEISLFGAKREESSSSATLAVIILANVNDSYTAPQELIPPNPAYVVPQQVLYQCDFPNNCSFEGVPASRWSTQYDQANCTNPYASYAIGNFTFGTCYRSPHDSYGVSYVRIDCDGEHTTSTRYFYGNGCETEVLSQTLFSACGPTSNQMLQCTAPPPSDPTPTPPSSASSLSSSLASTLLFVTILAFLLLLY